MFSKPSAMKDIVNNKKQNAALQCEDSHLALTFYK